MKKKILILITIIMILMGICTISQAANGGFLSVDWTANSYNANAADEEVILKFGYDDVHDHYYHASLYGNGEIDKGRYWNIKSYAKL